ncbi:Leucine-rich repeat serine/threonine-protein kinase 1 [Hypsibius exemplaris]|uniref:non-specific serine/threonine protein kinase n=1 Tax=Hypsibius exemplaris TaxID=2072580 RepID=A0A1W0WKA2_HYPEX|nr:Leucine-rich repeat serine/threonine-protein kinase 1 [Hypsibius exemplaris]
MADEDFPGRLLHQACMWENAELLEDLLSNGEEVKNIDSEDKYGRTPLHSAAKSGNASLVAVLLSSGAAPNVQSSLRAGAETPLHIAAHHGRLEAVAGLLSAGATTTIRNAKGQTPLDVAVERKHRDCVEMLKIYQVAKAEKLVTAKADFLDAFLAGNSALVETVLDSVHSDAGRLIDSTTDNGIPVVFEAVSQNDVGMVRLFLEKGASVDFVEKDHNPLYEAAFRGNQEIVKLLLKACPALASRSNELGWLPLHVAVNLQHRDIVDQILTFPYPDSLLQPYVDVTMTWTYRLAFDMNSVTVDGQSPLYLGVETGNLRLVEQLIAKKVKAVNEKDESRDISPLQLDLPSYNGETALYAAVKLKHHPIMRLLLEQGADADCRVSLGDPAESSNNLAAAVRNNDLTAVNLLLANKATDVGHYGLSAASMNGVTQEIREKILALHAHRDTEYKINKKVMELATSRGIRSHSSPSGSLTYSSIFPTVPVAISWQNTKNLSTFDESWLLYSAIILNPKVAGGMALYGITKLDISNGSLEEIPTCVFRLQSLRCLNASRNRIARFQSLELCRNISACQCPVLQDVNLSYNSLTAAPDDLFYFPALISLDLSYNSISVVPFALWQAVSLKEINFSHNLIETLPLKSDRNLGSSSESRTVSMTLSESGSESSVNESDMSTLSLPEISIQPVHRKNLWTSRLTVETAAKSVESKSERGESALKQINLSHNALTSPPLGLSCLAPNLTKLILSHNKLGSSGIIQDYPAGLKHLELAGNLLEEELRPGTADEMDGVCYFEDSSWAKGKPRMAISEQACVHRRHWKLDNLRTLTVAHNLLTSFDVTGGPPAKRGSRASTGSSGRLDSSMSSGSSLLYPNLSSLDVSDNKISDIPESYSNLTALSVLSIENNAAITDIPPQLGLLQKMWTLNANGCNLSEPLKSMFENKQYKTADILGYLKSSLERCQPYARMKLMLVGLENKGKTSLLRALKSEETKAKQRDSSNWSQRMTTEKSKRISSTQLSTVGIDLGEWVCSVDGVHDVTFRTWDFAGQREYYATHQYFLSRRSIYLVVWNMMDGVAGIREVTQWLVNIQARAPSSPVIIVGTHLDEIRGTKNAPDLVEDLKREVRQRFMGVIDADKHGLPRVIGCIEVSSKTRANIAQLGRMVAETAWEIRSPGTTKRLMEQQIPAIYAALEDLVSSLAFEYRESGQHPVVTTEYFRAIVAHEIYERFNLTFRDSAELRQAVMFLHDNGILLHYEDSSGLKDLYFLDPQWLCDTLASVITVREINPFVKKGIMKIDDLKVLFKPSKYALIDIHTYILNLLNKFEVALKLDSRTLLIPSMLPVKGTGVPESSLEAMPLKIEIKSGGRNWIHFKPYLESPEEPAMVMEGLTTDPNLHIRRFYTMLYFPSGFWPRLTSRLISDEKFYKDLRGYYSDETRPGLAVEWLCWQNAMELRFGNLAVLRLKDLNTSTVLPESVLHNHDGTWKELHLENKAIVEVEFPLYKKADQLVVSSVMSVSQLVNRCVNHIDALLEDWYPSLGTRFIHTSTGQFLVTKFIPCVKCMAEWRIHLNGGASIGPAEDSQEVRFRTFSVEQTIYRAITGHYDLLCPEHGSIAIGEVAPETMFLDLPPEKLLFPGDLKRGRILGRGAFGFVYRASVKPTAFRTAQDVAVKMLLPVDPGFGAEPGVISAYKSVMQQWEHDPLQSYCKAYWTARQELSILTSLSHHHIVGLVGLCMQPLGIVLQLAPKGSLLDHLKALRQSSDRMSACAIQQVAVQISKALEYLHGFRIIYRDLKSDNVLVWSMEKKVLVKLTDYGISRAVTAASTTKGFAGTEAYIAPEIIQYGGEQEYNEGVDVFSFGMLMYELLTLKQPFDGQDQVKDFVLDGGRPPVPIWSLQYPSLLLDMTVLAWSQLPKDRPSSSQALSICSTPEFSHLQDVAMLEDVGLNIPMGGVFGLPDGIGIALTDGTLDAVSCNADRWNDAKIATVHNDAPVLHCLVMPDFIWLLRGKEVAVHQTSTRVRLPVVQSSALAELPLFAAENKLVEAFCRSDVRSYKLTSVTKDTLWGASDGGQLVIIHVKDDGIAQDLFLQHGRKLPGLRVVASAKDGLAWTYLDEGATIFCWKLVKPHIIHRLDCDRLIPVSESLDSIGIDETREEKKKRHICCMAFFEGLLYVGTVWGSLIIVESQTLNPSSVIRPHADRILAIIPLRFATDGGGGGGSATATRIVTVGQGYRDVISRFFPHDSVKQTVSPLTLCAVLWRTNDWAVI